MEDLISKSALLAEFDPDDTTMFDAIGVRYYIENAPTVEAAPVVHGKWIMRGGRFRCSECDAKALWRDAGGTGGFSHEFEQAKTCVCPNCAAKMDL